MTHHNILSRMLFIVCRLIGGLSIAFILVNPDKYIQALGEVIRNKRSKLGYSQESFAAEVGLHRTYIGQVERGEKNLTIKNIVKIAKVLEVKVSKIFQDIDRFL